MTQKYEPEGESVYNVVAEYQRMVGSQSIKSAEFLFETPVSREQAEELYDKHRAYMVAKKGPYTSWDYPRQVHLVKQLRIECN